MTEAFTGLDLPLDDRREGKVRISWALPGEPARRLFVTTDRISAFDRVIAGIPYKGQVLNQLAAWWMERTSGIIPNQLLAVPDPNVTIALDATPLPVEVVVRGAITGITSTSLWRQYADGARTIYGYHFPDGLRKNTMLPEPLVTPTTKPPAGSGLHDEPLTWAEVVERGLVESRRWEHVTEAALAIFRAGQETAAAAGLILADTKYEFGVLADGTVVLIDEVHTPDSSRYWVAASYDERLAADDEPESLDKEPLRQALAAAGYRGDGEPPALGDDVVEATSRRYIDAYQRITGTTFDPAPYPVAERIADDLDRIIGSAPGGDSA